MTGEIDLETFERRFETLLAETVARTDDPFAPLEGGRPRRLSEPRRRADGRPRLTDRDLARVLAAASRRRERPAFRDRQRRARRLMDLSEARRGRR